MIPGWIPEGIKESKGNIQLKLLCGADLLESFAIPGVWSEEDVNAAIYHFKKYYICLQF